ncbi:MAG: cysteine--tRNA ligase [Candidatus Methylarchaceae archaeon HK02M2]|nr:cysteine--tRNA ligase [Candidatus Methylarchaceae archaeon HK02M2]
MDALRVYNTYTKKKEDFKPIDGKRVKMFVCGPTVYDLSHLGHARTYVAYDVISRWLRYRGYDLFYLMNITDIDDKIIEKAKKRNEKPSKIAKEFGKLFFRDIKSLDIDTIDLFAYTSKHMPEIIDQIRRLIQNGFAYITQTGVYFDISKFEDYGKLSHQKPEELLRHRIELDSNKRNTQDFSLWKKRNDGNFAWGSPWGDGRPGWHIEDTAIAEKYLGYQYDIHGGGVDLTFPHHEAEIAQMESISSKKPMVKYWVHTGFLKVKGKKMAKSLGDFISIQDALKRYDLETIRLFLSSTHYHSNVNFDEKSLKQAKRTLISLYSTIDNVKRAINSCLRLTDDERIIKRKIKENKKKFTEAMDDDFNTPSALSYLYILAKDTNKLLDKQGSINERLADNIIATFKELGGIFGILQKERLREELSEDLEALIEEREKARERKDWRTADEIRNKLDEFGITLEDTSQGVRWKKK